MRVFIAIAVAICVDAFVVDDFGLHERAKREDALWEEELKNEAIGHILSGTIKDPAAFIANEQCFKQCRSKLQVLEAYNFKNDSSEEESKEQNESSLPSDLPYGIFLADGKDFNATHFANFCDDYSTAKQCLDECGVGFFTNLANNAMLQFEYMCTVERDNFPTYAACGKTADLEPCAEQCSPRRGLETLDKKENLDGFLGKVILTCNFFACQSECGAPLVVDACDGDKEAGRVFTEALTYYIGGLTNLLGMIGISEGGSAFDQCQAFIDAAPPLPSTVAMDFAANADADFEKDQKVAKRTQYDALLIEKLQSELEVIKMRNEVLTLQMEKLTKECQC